MKTKFLFYGLMAMFAFGSVSLTEMDSSKLADVVTVSSSDNSDELRSPAEKREEGYEATEARIEADLP